VWVQLLRVPYRYLFPPLVLFMIVGSYSVNNSVFDVGALLAFGMLGYALRRLDFDPAPLILAFVLGGPIETNLRQSLMMGHGSWLLIVERPISLTILVAAVAVAALPLFGAVRGRLREMRAVNEL
jgi:putative tricarboxylic transport membrane protein